ncbi:PLC-like phosphodiesterase [Powellomyces hirtus]|nr:PLC-like phosphodiesterase [Powellomyces hirtus]KAI8904218.1 PLC-like phosphodiesterase [Powellomyces hirtus]
MRLSLFLAAILPAAVIAAAPAPPSLICNGQKQNCALSLSRYTFPGTHSSSTSTLKGTGILLPEEIVSCFWQNQKMDINAQYDLGIRSFNFELAWRDNDVKICHGEGGTAKTLYGDTLWNQLKVIRAKLIANPSDIVMVNFGNNCGQKNTANDDIYRKALDVFVGLFCDWDKACDRGPAQPVHADLNSKAMGFKDADLVGNYVAKQQQVVVVSRFTGDLRKDYGDWVQHEGGETGVYRSSWDPKVDNANEAIASLQAKWRGHPQKSYTSTYPQHLQALSGTFNADIKGLCLRDQAKDFLKPSFMQRATDIARQAKYRVQVIAVDHVDAWSSISVGSDRFDRFSDWVNYYNRQSLEA